ncbi:LysR family transcriptional regulator [Peteryoungia algae]|jgi:DNA-binding transcriptional LysR family regulator|uniref:LysR family transcriptional regulator n=1 Tax=Peteryoungia algae TaxID=2919917 RepID=A0ABT0D426_9HYPH|nr:LysR family transcriptional regulator [Rhizobium sp. SSM4.3]MCJ8240160.1 LysR family transcriptional regulator [Rhizobium sp. SSM4.3]
MARQDINRSGEMEVFVQVVEQGGFSAAARYLRMTPSAVSKLVARLEARLGTRLVNRTTRKLLLTPEGRSFYERSVRILADMEEAERSAANLDDPRGLIRINTSAAYGTHVLAPLLAVFLETYPGISVEVAQTDLVIDLLAEQADIAIRAGTMRDSSLVARKLGETPLLIVASPAYLARHGVPETASDLERHNRLGFGYVRARREWSAPDGETIVQVPVVGRVSASDGEALRHFAIGGAGLVQLAQFTVAEDLKAGRLVTVLDDPRTRLSEPFHAVYVGQGGHLPARIRVMLDFLAKHGRVS